MKPEDYITDDTEVQYEEGDFVLLAESRQENIEVQYESEESVHLGLPGYRVRINVEDGGESVFHETVQITEGQAKRLLEAFGGWTFVELADE